MKKGYVMDVTSTTNVTKTISNSQVASNPNAKLTSQDFMKLFLKELQYQDPTKPMDTDKMLQQTSQMTQLQSSNELKDDLKKLVDKMDSSSQYSSISMIGKMANNGQNKIVISDAKNSNLDIPFKLYFKDDFGEANVKILDKNGNVVKHMDVKNGQKGVQDFKWNGKDDNGNPVDDGEYSIEADYTTTNNKKETAKLGYYPITSVKFDNGKTLVKMADNYIPLSSITEVSE
jgi:flagellar basal-body rod modification protein FlgD